MWSNQFKVGEYKNYTYHQYKNIQEKDQSDKALKERMTLIKANEVLYTVNQYGFRGALTFDDIDAVKSVAVGDSWTVAEGIPENKTFVSLLNTPTVNLGMSGASLDGITRLAQAVLNNFDLDQLFVTIPEITRLEFVTLHRDMEVTKTAGSFVIKPDWLKYVKKDNDVVDKYKRYVNYADEYDLWTRTYKSIMLINSLAEVMGVKVYYTCWSKYMHDKINEVCAPNICYLDKRIDRARDGLHPGIESHARIAEDLNKMSNRVNSKDAI